MNEHNELSGSISEGSPKQDEPELNPSLAGALLRMLPQDSYSTICMIGLLVGIWNYSVHQDSWLLATFLGIMGGSAAIGKARKK